MPRNSTVLDLSGPLADHHLGCDMRPGLALGARPRHPQRPAGAQARDELALERATAFDVKGLVDRLVADPHGLIIGEVGLEPVGDLLRAPGRHPPAVSAVWFVPPLPRSVQRTGDRGPVRPANLARQTLLHAAVGSRPAWPSS